MLLGMVVVGGEDLEGGNMRKRMEEQRGGRRGFTE